MLGTGFSIGNIMTSGQAQLHQEQTTDGNAIFNTLQQFAGALGTAVVSLIMALAQAGSTSAHNTAIGSQHAFGFLLLLTLVGDVAIFFGLRRRRGETENA